ncbi:inositol-trisphosphate 3-kinase C-like isoform X2 [Mytilus californianus]|uniref:inositol-trisphosphate 3-kinase C-like isoform X2 n=1 Tax=Mytilus californianus TaxID=6549 RepID=UPI00224807B9|nr:inositol-trisphosphate 3-kinase C-like isoform X2 [Mytilus californianus]
MIRHGDCAVKMEEKKRETSPPMDLKICTISDQRTEKSGQYLLDRSHLFTDVNSPHLSNMPKHPFQCNVNDSQIIPEKQRKWPTEDSVKTESASGSSKELETLNSFKHRAIFHNPTETISSCQCVDEDDDDNNKQNRQGETCMTSEHSRPKDNMFYLREEDNTDPVWLNFDSELKPISHLLLSPRNSNGSICSNRSSNADSAVDLLTPDEEPQSDYHDTNSSQCVDWFKDNYRKPHQQLSTESGIDFQTFCKNVDVPAVVVSDHSGPSEKDEVRCNIKDLISEQTNESHLNLDRQLSVDSDDSRPYSNSSIISGSRSNSSTSLTDLTDFDEPTEDIPDLKPVKRQSSVYWKKMKNIVIWSPFIQQFKKHRYPWIQLAGHQGNFQAGEKGSVLKKYDNREQKAFLKLMKDILRPYVPEYRGVVEKKTDQYLELQDLLCDFDTPFVMDIKMGTRTYLEEELVKAKEKPKPRKDMYQKMVEVDPSAPTPEEHKQKSIIKPRYMQWRDEMSSSVDLGFRIEGIKRMDGASSKNFKKTKTRNEVKDALSLFIGNNQIVLGVYIRRLKAILATQESSDFFKSHELIGSSLLFVHDKTNNADVWMIDFGKTEPLPSGITTNHRTPWVDGNHEDGYSFGLDNLLLILKELETPSSSSSD